MARMHSRRRGKSGSKRPLVSKSPEWVPLEPKEIEERVVDLAAQGKTSAQIGAILRDQYGVPNVRLATGKPLTAIMKAKGTKFEMPEDLDALMKRAVELQVHMQANRRDGGSRRNLQLLEARIRRLAEYYVREGVLPETWDYAVKIQELAAK